MAKQKRNLKNRSSRTTIRSLKRKNIRSARKSRRRRSKKRNKQNRKKRSKRFSLKGGGEGTQGRDQRSQDAKLNERAQEKRKATYISNLKKLHDLNIEIYNFIEENKTSSDSSNTEFSQERLKFTKDLANLTEKLKPLREQIKNAIKSFSEEEKNEYGEEFYNENTDIDNDRYSIDDIINGKHEHYEYNIKMVTFIALFDEAKKLNEEIRELDSKPTLDNHEQEEIRQKEIRRDRLLAESKPLGERAQKLRKSFRKVE